MEMIGWGDESEQKTAAIAALFGVFC